MFKGYNLDAGPRWGLLVSGVRFRSTSEAFPCMHTTTLPSHNRSWLPSSPYARLPRSTKSIRPLLPLCTCTIGPCGHHLRPASQIDCTTLSLGFSSLGNYLPAGRPLKPIARHAGIDHAKEFIHTTTDDPCHVSPQPPRIPADGLLGFLSPPDIR